MATAVGLELQLNPKPESGTLPGSQQALGGVKPSSGFMSGRTQRLMLGLDLVQGGGAFLATAVGLELQLNPIPESGTLPGVTAVWPLPLAGAAFQWFYEWKETAPMEFEAEFATATLPPPIGQVALVDITNWDPNNSSDINAAFEVQLSQCGSTGAACEKGQMQHRFLCFACLTVDLP